MKNYKEYITQNAKIRDGQPCLRDTGIAVNDIETFLAYKMTVTDILEEFSELAANDIKAAKAYLKANQ